SLEEEAVGLRADNTRYAFVEVKKQVPILVIDGEGAAGAKRGGGTFFLQTVFTAAKGYQIVPAGVEVLEKPNLLREYPCVFLLNVPDLKERALKNLEEFAKNGGGVAFFLGDKVKLGEYNSALYNNGKGIFPAPLSDRGVEDNLTAEEKENRFLHVFNGQQKVY